MPRKTQKEDLPRLYRDLADWFHLLTAPEDYREEAAFYSKILRETSRLPVKNVLEMGSGGGNNALHMKADFELTLTDLSEDMLAISRRLNPECEHIPGDMRSLRLGRQFDAVFVHDAVSYLTTLAGLSQTMETAFIHCKPGGTALFMPDCTRESFQPATSHGGHDGQDGRALRYLEWIYDPDPADTTYVMDFAYLLKNGDVTTTESERHVMGLFSEREWLETMSKAGFKTEVIKPRVNWAPPAGLRLFLGIKPE